MEAFASELEVRGSFSEDFACVAEAALQFAASHAAMRPRLAAIEETCRALATAMETFEAMAEERGFDDEVDCAYAEGVEPVFGAVDAWVYATDGEPCGALVEAVDELAGLDDADMSRFVATEIRPRVAELARAWAAAVDATSHTA